MSNTPQGGTIEGNVADDALMVNQGKLSYLLKLGGVVISHPYRV